MDVALEAIAEERIFSYVYEMGPILVPSRMSLNVYLDRAQEGAAVRRREFGGCLGNGVAYGWGSRDGLEVVCELPPKLFSNCVFCLYSYASSSMSYKWNYILYSLLRLSFFHLIYLRFIHVVAFTASSFFITE